MKPSSAPKPTTIAQPESQPASNTHTEPHRQCVCELVRARGERGVGWRGSHRGEARRRALVVRRPTSSRRVGCRHLVPAGCRLERRLAVEQPAPKGDRESLQNRGRPAASDATVRE